MTRSKIKVQAMKKNTVFPLSFAGDIVVVVSFHILLYLMKLILEEFAMGVKLFGPIREFLKD